MICPFCRCILQGARWGKPKALNEDWNPAKIGARVFFELTCMGKYNDPPCDFRALLERPEYEKFEKRGLPTDAWLQETGELCPECGKKIFLRIREGKRWRLCEDFFHRDGKCTYQKKL